MVCGKQACELPPQFTINSRSYEQKSLKQPSAAPCASSPAIRVSSCGHQLLNQDPIKTRFHMCPCHPGTNQPKNLLEVQIQHRRKENLAIYSCWKGESCLERDNAPPVNNLLPLAAGESLCRDEPLCSSPTVSLLLLVSGTCFASSTFELAENTSGFAFRQTI